MRQRCTVVANIDRGALCAAVATTDEAPLDSSCIKMRDQITAVKNLGTSSRPCYAGEDPARLDRLSALAAEMEGYQLLKDNQSLSQGQDTNISTCPVSMSRTATERHLCGFRKEAADPRSKMRLDMMMMEMTTAEQHTALKEALKDCGYNVTTMPIILRQY
ncbi:MAG: hypothetical protein FRX49_08802 [Trebouxia sp. A1-2]|nr:MAG: hypothetical protein FRX49_08802 [Trebouxia sp. A1-2]